MLEEAANAGTPLRARLAADLELEGAIVIPSGVPAFTLDGGGRWGLVFVAALDAAIRIEGSTRVDLVDFTADANGDATRLCTSFLTTDTAHTGLRMRGVYVNDCTNLLDPAKAWQDGSIVDCGFATSTPTASMTFGNTASVGSIAFYDLVNVLGNLSFALRLGSGAVRATHVNDAFQTIATLDTSGVIAATSNVFIGCNFTTITLRTADVFVGGENRLARLPRGVALGANNVQLSTAGPTLTVGEASVLRLDIAAGASGSIILSDGLSPGQQVQIVAVAVVGTATLPNNTANNTRLSAIWAPGQWDTLSLVWDDTDGNWIELARSNN